MDTVPIKKIKTDSLDRSIERVAIGAILVEDEFYMKSMEYKEMQKNTNVDI